MIVYHYWDIVKYMDDCGVLPGTLSTTVYQPKPGDTIIVKIADNTFGIRSNLTDLHIVIDNIQLINNPSMVITGIDLNTKKPVHFKPTADQLKTSTWEIVGKPAPADPNSDYDRAMSII